jgi:transcriptional regulator with XRE-family HTH domain
MSNYQASRIENEDSISLLFAKNLKTCRQAKGISQEELALTAVFSRSYNTEIETGKRNPSLLNLVKIMKVLDVDANTLLNFTNRQDNTGAKGEIESGKS